MIDGRRDPQYTSEYAKYRFFNYGLDPNMASGELYSFVGWGPDPDNPSAYIQHVYVYYAQNPREINDNTYGTGSHATWTQGKGHLFTDLVGSDMTEFIFFDSGGNIRLSFFSDYAHGEGRGNTWNPPYRCGGFWEGDGQLLINQTPYTTVDTLKAQVKFSSSLVWNVNVLANGSTSVPCGSGTLNPRVDSPPLTYGSPPNYSLYQVADNCSALNDWEFSYAIEFSIPVRAFPNEPIVEIVARAHNSPAKNGEDDSPTQPAQASIGDYVWFDTDRDGAQDSSEKGIPNVKVWLYWDRNNNGQFENDELIITTRTDANGYYLFKGLSGGAYSKTINNQTYWFYNGEYKVVVDTTTLPGAVSTALAGGVDTQLMTDMLTTGSQTVTVTPGAMQGVAVGTQLRIGGSVPETVTVTAVPSSSSFTATFTQRHYVGDSVNLVTSSGTNQVLTPASMDGILPGRTLLIGGTNPEYVEVLSTTSTTFTATLLSTHSVGDLITAAVNYEQTAPKNYADTAVVESYILSDNVAQFPDLLRGRPKLEYPEDCRTADFGYVPAGAVIGDFVWYDVDGDAIQDPGEMGISGVHLQLTNLDTEETWTTVTGVDGGYLFYGLEPGTYKVDCDTTGLLADYTHTIGVQSMYDPSPNITLGTNEINLGVDFGYFKPGGVYGTIGDKVFFDANWSMYWEDTGSGDTGFANVGLGLWRDTNYNGVKDSTDEYVGSTVTNSSGTYWFTGLPVTPLPSAPSGTDYITYFVQVMDGSGVLDGYDKFYPGTYRQTNLQAASPTKTFDDTLDFPYVAVGYIGDFIWEDLINNGYQDAGEPGIQGAVIDLYQYNLVETTWAFRHHGRTTTDAQGKYAFTGLRTTYSGSHTRYYMTITPPAGYTDCIRNVAPENSIPPANYIENDSNHFGSSYEIYLGGSYRHANRSVDKGYVTSATRGSIGNFIWFDDDGDGLQNECLPRGVNGVTLELRNSNGVTIQTTETKAQCPDSLPPVAGCGCGTANDGWYQFSGVPLGAYIVVVTDVNGYLTGYTRTTPDSVMTVELTSSNPNVRTADAGYYKLPTSVQVSDFRAYTLSGTTVVEWETSAESGTAGFRLFRREASGGDYYPVNKQLVPALPGSSGGTYRLIDPVGFQGQTLTYQLLEIERKGTTRTYGPYVVTVEQGEGTWPSGKPFQRIARPPNEENKLRAEARAVAKAAHLKKGKKGPALKIPVEESGLKFLSSESIASGFGLTVSATRQAVSRRQFELSTQGREVAYLPAVDGSGLYFYGEGAESVYTRQNVYWLRSGNGIPMQSVSGKTNKLSVPVATFTETLHLEQDVYDSPDFSLPDSDYWYWNYMIGGYEDTDTNSFDVPTPGVTAGEGLIKVNLRAFYDTAAAPENRVLVTLNEQSLGEGEWDGLSPYTLDLAIPSGVLSGDSNELRIQAVTPLGIECNMIWVDSFDVTYPRLFHAVEDKLEFAPTQKGVVTVDGFSSDSILVFDLANQDRPQVVTPQSIERSTAGYRVTFLASTIPSRYLALTYTSAGTITECFADTPSDLKKAPGADYLILTTGELVETAQTLADYRSSQELQSIVVDIEDVLDEFNYGVSSPGVLREFIGYTQTKWKKKPRYIVFAGDGSWDYRDNYGLDCNLIPALMVSTPYGLYPSDNAYGDVDGDFVPDVAIGRLPVVSPAELEAVIGKLKAYEQAPGGAWDQTVLLLADNPDPDAGDFPIDSDTLLDWIPPTFVVKKVYVGQVSAETARTETLAAINAGCSLVNYIGHGSPTALASEKLIDPAAIVRLTNTTMLPVFSGMTCFVNMFANPIMDCLGSRLVRSPLNGGIAVWSSSGQSENDDSLVLDREFFRRRFTDQDETVGDLVNGALRDSASKGVEGYVLYLYGLIGDPASRLR